MKKIISGLAIATGISLGFIPLGWAENAEEKIIWTDEVEAKEVELEIVLIVDKNGKATSLRYILSNNSKDILRVWPPDLGPSLLVIQTPSGKIDNYGPKRKIYISGLPLVHPGTSKHWDRDMNILDYLQYRMKYFELTGKDNPCRDEKTGKLIPGDYTFSWQIERYILTDQALRSWWLYCQRAFSPGDSVDTEDFRDWRYEIPKQDLERAKDADLSSNPIIFTIQKEEK